MEILLLRPIYPLRSRSFRVEVFLRRWMQGVSCRVELIDELRHVCDAEQTGEHRERGVDDAGRF